MTMDKAISEMLDRQGIRDLMARYYRGIDRKDVELIGDEVAPKPTSNMVHVRRDLRALLRNGGGRAGIREIREKYGLNPRWESNAIEALNL